MPNETPILFFSPGTCSFGCIVAAEWSGAPYKLCMLDRPQRTSDEYKMINPKGQVPALQIGSNTVTENSAILLHFAARKPELLQKPGTAEFDLQNQIFSYLASGFHAAFYPFFAPQKYSGNEETQKELKQFSKANIRRQYDLMESTIERKDYLVGNKLSVVDPYFYGMARWGQNIFDVKSEFPAIGQWQARVEKEPAVQYALATEKADGSAKTSGQFQGLVKLSEVTPLKKAA